MNYVTYEFEQQLYCIATHRRCRLRLLPFMAAFRFVKVFLILFVIWFPFNFLRLKVNIDVSSLKDLRNRYLLTISTTFEGRRLLPVRDISEGRASLCHLCFMSDDVKVFSFLSEEFLARPRLSPAQVPL